MADTYSQDQHHIGLTDPTTSELIGMVCAKVNGELQYKEFDDEFLAQQFFTGSASYVNTPPERRLLHTASDWRGGFGLEYEDSDEPRRYYLSNGMDLRHKGMAIAGWSYTNVTVTELAITDGGLEIWTDPNTLTNWTYSETNANFTLDKESVIVDAGTYSAKISFVADPGAGQSAQILQAAVTWSNAYRGSTIAIRVRVYNSNIANLMGSVTIDDGASTTSVNSAGSGAWETVYVTHKLSATASKCEVILKAERQGAVAAATYFDNVMFPTDTTSGCQWEEFDDDLFFTRGGYLYRVNNLTGAVTMQAGFPNTISKLCKFQVSGLSYLFIFQGTSYPYYYMSTGETVTRSTAATNTFQFAAWVNTTVDTIFANTGNNTIYSTTNPLNGGTAWGNLKYVGDAETPITNLLEKDGALLIDKEDMPYYLDSTGAVKKDLAPSCRSGRATHSGKNSCIWQGEYFRPTGDQALLRVGTEKTWIQPSKFITNNSEFTGQVEACAGDEEWLYVITDNGATEIEVLCYREQDIEGVSIEVWHPVLDILSLGCESCFISSVYQKRLWIGGSVANAQVSYIPLPTQYGDITNDSNRYFSTDTYFETQWYHGDFRSDDKAWTKITVSLGHAHDVDIYFECWFKKWGDSLWTDAGDLKGTATDRTATLYFNTWTPTSPFFKIKFVAKTDDTTKTPILLDYTIESVLYPPVRRTIACTVVCAESFTNRSGQHEDGGEMQFNLIKNTIENCRDAIWMVTIKDIDGTTRYVKLLKLPSNVPRYNIIKDAEGKEQERWYNLLMQEYTFS